MIPRNDESNQTSNVFNAIYKMYSAVCPGTSLRLDDLQAIHPQNEGGEFGSQAQHPQMPLNINVIDGTGPNVPPATSWEQSLSDIPSKWGLQNETDWDFNFPTIDLESFLSVHPTGAPEEASFSLADPFSVDNLSPFPA